MAFVVLQVSTTGSPAVITVGEAVIFAVGAGTTTGGAVGADGGAIFFLQPATATKATSSTTGTRIRLRRSNGLLLQKKHEHFHDNSTLPQPPAAAVLYRGALQRATSYRP